jgi:hypothetical protein
MERGVVKKMKLPRKGNAVPYTATSTTTTTKQPLQQKRVVDLQWAWMLAKFGNE